MSRLIRSNLIRMLKSYYFWICTLIQLAYIVISFFLRLFFTFYGNLDTMFLSVATIENTAFPSAGFAVLIMGIFFVGEDYSTKAIDSKIISGFSKTEIYMSYFFTVFIGSMIMTAAKLLTFSATAVPLVMKGYCLEYRSQYLLAVLFLSVFLMLFYSALSVFIATLSKNTATALWITFIIYLAFLVMIIANIVKIDYLEQDYLEHSVQSKIHDYSGLIQDESLPPKRERDFYKFWADYLPFLQCYQISFGLPLCIWQMTIYSCINIAIVIGGGVFFFRRQELK